MSDILLPLHLRHAKTTVGYVDSTGLSRGLFTGAARTVARGGDRLRASIQFTSHGGSTTNERSNRAVLRSFLARLRGMQNRAYIADLSYQRRGSFPTGELLGTFTNAADWSNNSQFSGRISDRMWVVMCIAQGGTCVLRRAALVTTTQYAPYALRAFIANAVKPGLDGSLPPFNGVLTSTDSAGSSAGTLYASTSTVPLNGMVTLAFVPWTASASYRLNLITSVSQSGQELSIPYASFARCLLVDLGTNALVRSDELDNASWTKTAASVSANATSDPTGTSAADSIIEDTSVTTAHQVSQIVTIPATSGIDYAFAVALKAGTRSWVRLHMQRNSNQAGAYFDLTNGVVGTLSVGSNWSNVRASIASLGNGWYYCCVVGQSADTTTSILGGIRLASADNSSNYTGDGSSNAYAWRATLAQSSVPMRLVQTTSAASTGTVPTGSGIYVKGGPASAQASLLIDDQVELITSLGSELKLLAAPVDFDAAGLGYLSFEPALRGSLSDNMPVIVNQPFGRFIYAGDSIGWDNDPGYFSTASCEFEEACL